MRLHRFIDPSFDLRADTITVTSRELLNQWRNVLRLGQGDAVILSDGRGTEAQAVFTTLHPKEALLTIGNHSTPSREPVQDTHLYVALLRRENFEIVVQKATELGVGTIVPLHTARTVKTGFNRTRLEKIILEAAEQSGRTTLPTLKDPVSLESALTSAPSESYILHLDVPSLAATAHPKALFVGPEGGFTAEEIQEATTHGIRAAALGNLTLRGETAAIVASYLLSRP
jgi:16S rRNA (uracil1498-N3)-methyltransferase